jgi:hypothetical protein
MARGKVGYWLTRLLAGVLRRGKRAAQRDDVNQSVRDAVDLPDLAGRLVTIAIADLARRASESD